MLFTGADGADPSVVYEDLSVCQGLENASFYAKNPVDRDCFFQCEADHQDECPIATDETCSLEEAEECERKNDACAESCRQPQ